MEYQIKGATKGVALIGKIIPVDSETGEVVSGVYVTTQEERDRRRRYFENKEKWKVELSGFFFYLHKTSKGFTELKPANAARLMYLATYLSYHDNYLYSTQKTKMTKEMLPVILGLKKDAVYSFLHDTLSSGYLKEDGGYLRLSQAYFQRGEVIKSPNIRITKVFIDTVRDLYHKTPPPSHSCLGYIFMLIPLINVQWNIICRNQFESEIENVEPLSIGEFCDLIGYDRSHASRLIKKFYSITFDVKGKKQRFCSFVYEKNKTDMKIFCNPNIFYSGKNKEKLDGMKLFF